MAYFPLFIDLDGADVLLVGGGSTAHRKMETLLEFGAKVTVVSPKFTGDFAAAQTVEAPFRPEFLADRSYALVIAATDSGAVNHEVCEAAKARNIPVNSVDDRENCTFFFPAILKDGDVVVGISSGGKSPLVVQAMKERIRSVFPKGIGKINEQMSAERAKIREKIPGTTANDQKKRAEYLKARLKELL